MSLLKRLSLKVNTPNLSKLFNYSFTDNKNCIISDLQKKFNHHELPLKKLISLGEKNHPYNLSKNPLDPSLDPWNYKLSRVTRKKLNLFKYTPAVLNISSEKDMEWYLLNFPVCSSLFLDEKENSIIFNIQNNLTIITKNKIYDLKGGEGFNQEVENTDIEIKNSGKYHPFPSKTVLIGQYKDMDEYNRQISF